MSQAPLPNTAPNTAHLDDRAVLQVCGSEALDFLQNLITNDMKQVSANKGLFAFLLSAQGKYLHDFFILQDQSNYLLVVAKDQLDGLHRRLKMLKLRADVSLDVRDDLQVFSQWPINNARGDFGAGSDGLTLCDGRGNNLAQYHLTSDAIKVSASAEDFYAHLADQGIPTPHRDFISDKTTMMDAGLDGQFAISWTKGCFVGQELTARVKYRGLVKRLLVPTQEPHLAGTNLVKDGKVVGVMQSQRFAHIKREGIGFDAEDTLSDEAGNVIRLLRPQWWEHSQSSQEPV